MANEESASSDREDYVFRFGVRIGHKRELAFALQSQASFSLSRTRTRSGTRRSSPSPSPRSAKRIRKSAVNSRDLPSPFGADADAAVGGLPAVLEPAAPPGKIDTTLAVNGSEADSRGSCGAPNIPLEEPPDEDHREEPPGSITRLALKSACTEIPAVPTNDGPREVNRLVENGSETIDADSKCNENSHGRANFPAIVVETPTEQVELVADGSGAVSFAGTSTVMVDACQGFETECNVPANSVTTKTSAFKVVPGVSEDPPPPPQTPMEADKLVELLIDVRNQQGVTAVDSKATSTTTTATAADCRGPTVETPVVVVDDQQESKVESDVMSKPRFKRLAMKVLKENTLIVRNEPGLPGKPARRVTRSLLNTAMTEDSAAGEIAGTAIGLIGSNKTRDAGTSGVDGSSSLTLGKMELKMSKKIALHKLPTNVRELLNTGLLEGLPVKYIVSVGKQVGLEGVVSGNGILCSCNSCNGSKVVSAYNFELHAGSNKKHPSDFIYLGNGKSLRDILTECRSAPLDMLEAAIQHAIASLPQSKLSVCQNCKESLYTPRSGKFGFLCDSCLPLKQRQQTSPTQSEGTLTSAKLSGKAFSGCTSDGPSRSLTSLKKNPGSMSNSQKKSAHGKLTRKDLGLHKLVFMDDILPEGTEVAYYVRGTRLRDGYIKDSGIYCHCCNSVISPSQFEAHAGQAARRKPYNNIYTSNGVSLHELSVSLSTGRKLLSSENDDLCSICADGGDLLLCDLCPRAFHKECVGLSTIPKGNWYCRYCHDIHQKERSVRYNDNAIAAGRVAGVDPIEQIIKRCIRFVTTSTDYGACVLCRCHDFSKSGFDGRTVLICDQCEKEYHVGCLKDHDMCELKELPEGEWFCCAGCSEIHASLHKLLLCGPEPLQSFHKSLIRKKYMGKCLSKDATEIGWRLLSGKTSSVRTRLLLSEAVSIFHESFDPIVDAATGRDLIPSMVYGRSVRDQDFGGMYCAILTVNSSVVSAGILRILGSDVAELPLVATSMERQGQGYFQSLFSCIERLLEALKVKHFVLPAAEEAESIWTKKFGFSKISLDQLHKYTKGARPIIFEGTSLLHKQVSLLQPCLQENHGS